MRASGIAMTAVTILCRLNQLGCLTYSSLQNCQPEGGGPHLGSGFQPGGGVHPCGGVGQFGGDTYRLVMQRSSLAIC